MKSLFLLHAETESKLLCDQPNSFSSALASAILQALKAHLRRVEMVTPLALATMVDPRFKHLGFRDSAQRGQIVSQLKNELFQEEEAV